LPQRGGKKLTMSKFWRRVVPALMAGGLIAGIVPAEAASAAPTIYGVTINATSPHYPSAVHGKVDGFALVVYKTPTNNLNTATISGAVTGASSNDVATLLQEPFGAKTFTPTGTPVTLTGAASQNYSFSVQPLVATKYEVQVTTSTTTDVTSAIQTVYVTEGGTGSSATHCSHFHCTTTAKSFIKLPAAAYKTESVKRWFLYFVIIGKTLPKTVPLAKNATASKARKINAGEYEVIFTFKYTTHISKPQNHILTFGCTRDTETKDGFGLPGRHHCGDKRLSILDAYVG
jgi:hypothetical protein